MRRKIKSYKFPFVSISMFREKMVDFKVDCPKNMVRLLTEFYKGKDRESVVVVMLDGNNNPIGIQEVSIGTVTCSLIHPREIFKPAILMGASAIIVAHNHPSGSLTPSSEDKQSMSRIKKAGELIGISLIDDMIYSPTGYYSSREHGVLNGSDI